MTQIVQPGAGLAGLAANPRPASEQDEGLGQVVRVHRPTGCEHEHVVGRSAPPLSHRDVDVEGAAGALVQGHQTVPAVLGIPDHEPVRSQVPQQQAGRLRASQPGACDETDDEVEGQRGERPGRRQGQRLRHDLPDLLRRRNARRRPVPYRLAEGVPVRHLVTGVPDMEEDGQPADDAQAPSCLVDRRCRAGPVQDAACADERVALGVGKLGIIHQDPFLCPERQAQRLPAGDVAFRVIRHGHRASPSKGQGCTSSRSIRTSTRA